MSANEHECRICNDSFETEEPLNDHMESEHEEQSMV